MTGRLRYLAPVVGPPRGGVGGWRPPGAGRAGVCGGAWGAAAGEPFAALAPVGRTPFSRSRSG